METQEILDKLEEYHGGKIVTDIILKLKDVESSSLMFQTQELRPICQNTNVFWTKDGRKFFRSSEDLPWQSSENFFDNFLDLDFIKVQLAQDLYRKVSYKTIETKEQCRVIFYCEEERIENTYLKVQFRCFTEQDRELLFSELKRVFQESIY